LGGFCALAALMGVPGIASLQAPKPQAPAWLKHDNSMTTVVQSKHYKITVQEMMEMIASYSEVQTEPDLSHCVHVMHPNRMADMPGYTVFYPRREEMPRFKLEETDDGMEIVEVLKP